MLSRPSRTTDRPPVDSSQTRVIDKSDERIRNMFAEIAPRYDLLNHLLSAGVDIYWRRRTAKRVLPLPEGPILDVCAGTGDLSFALQRRFRGERRIIAADFCRPMLAIGRQKAHKKRCESIAWLEADTQRLPFADDTFALVCVAFGLRNVADTDAGLAEMVRTTKPGGKVAILEFTLPRGIVGKLYAWYFHRVLPRIGQALAGNRYAAYNYLPVSVSEFPQYEGLCQQMERAGLHSVRFLPMTFGIATLYIGTK